MIWREGVKGGMTTLCYAFVLLLMDTSHFVFFWVFAGEHNGFAAIRRSLGCLSTWSGCVWKASAGAVLVDRSEIG